MNQRQALVSPAALGLHLLAAVKVCEHIGQVPPGTAPAVLEQIAGFVQLAGHQQAGCLGQSARIGSEVACTGPPGPCKAANQRRPNQDRDRGGGLPHTRQDTPGGKQQSRCTH